MAHGRNVDIEFDEKKIDLRDVAGMREMFKRMVRSLDVQITDIVRKLSGATTGDEATKRSWTLG